MNLFLQAIWNYSVSTQKPDSLIYQFQIIYTYATKSSVKEMTCFTVDFVEVKTAPTECKEKCFQMKTSVYLHYSETPTDVLMLMIHLRMRSVK